ncbi:MAG: pitrilysin family protein, partial [Candidatus Eisenbacteria bacterium]|nr:pitrilysin family protein [Candidatus Eisenbacteria bacterium]
LPNGLTVVTASALNAPVFTAMLVVEGGSRYDREGSAGLAALVGGVLLEGSTSRSPASIAVAIDSMGSALDTATGYETTAVVVSGLAAHCRESLRLLSEVATSPALAPAAVAESVRRQLAELAEDEAQAYDVCRRDFMKTVFRGHPRRNPVGGLPETVSKLTGEDLESFHQRYYRPGNAVLAVVGDLDASEMLDLAAESFGSWQGVGPPACAPPLPVRQFGRRIESVEMDTRQVHVSIGNLAIARSDPLFYATSVMDVILGDSAGFGSRLATKLREEHGLAYVIESDTSGSAGLEPGVFWAYTATSPEHFEQLVRGIMDELRLIRKEPPSVQELESAVGYLTGRDLLDRETSEAVAGRLVHAERHALGLDFDARYPSIIASVSREDVLEAARAVIDPENCSFVTVGPVTPRDGSLLDS